MKINLEKTIEYQKLDNSSWLIKGEHKSAKIYYQVYAYDFSVRGAHLDHQHAFFNGTSTFLQVEGLETQRCELTIEPTTDTNWSVATSMTPSSVCEKGFGVYSADSYDELIDHPVEIGELKSISFDVKGVHHSVAFVGQFKGNLQRIANDLKMICEQQVDFF